MSRLTATVLLLALQLAVPHRLHADVLQEVEHGRLERLNDTLVVTLSGSPEEMGHAYGTLLKPVIQRVIRDVLQDDILREPAARENLMRANAIMARHQPERFLRELKAVAKAAEVDEGELQLLQWFGDVQRVVDGAGHAPFCTSFAILPPRSADGHLIVGRNLDYRLPPVAGYAAIIMVARPAGRRAFVSVSGVGFLNGWTLMNEDGIVVSNNTCFGARNESLEALSTCYLLRDVAESCMTLDAAVAHVRASRRACGTAMLVAAGQEKRALILEYDHDRVAVREPRDGFVGAANEFLELYGMHQRPGTGGRLGLARMLVEKHKGPVGFDSNIAGEPAVPIHTMNLHSVTIDATARRLRVHMGAIPAYLEPGRAFRFDDGRLTPDTDANLPARSSE